MSENIHNTTSDDAQAHEQAMQPNPMLKSLDVLVGTWDLTGRVHDTGEPIKGQLLREWLAGGFYLVQHANIDYAGREITGTEYVGYDPANQNLRSYFFSNDGPGPFGGIALEYVWEVGDDTLTIWGGFVGSPAFFKGTFSEDRSTITGAWQWPGGGYDATATRRK